jgi:plastocyanin
VPLLCPLSSKQLKLAIAPVVIAVKLVQYGLRKPGLHNLGLQQLPPQVMALVPRGPPPQVTALVPHGPLLQVTPLVPHGPLLQVTPLVLHGPLLQVTPLVLHGPLLQVTPLVPHGPLLQVTALVPHGLHTQVMVLVPRTPPQVTALVAQAGAIKITTAVFNVCYNLNFSVELLILILTECVTSVGGPSATYTPTATSVSGSGSSGATHTVIVAPTQGLLRFVPFALNASVGDTIQFHWGANNHTVTKSSSLTPCNKTSDHPFSSGEQNQGFVCRVSCLILGFYDH